VPVAAFAVPFVSRPPSMCAVAEEEQGVFLLPDAGLGSGVS